MDEWHYEQAQRREEAEREAAIATAREKARARVAPLMFEGVAHCPDCVQPLAPHRIEAGICVPCLSLREKQGKA